MTLTVNGNFCSSISRNEHERSFMSTRRDGLHSLQARTQGGGGGGGGFTVANEPPWKFQVSFQNQRHARSLGASTFSRSITAVFHASHTHACARSFNFQGSDRCIARKTVLLGEAASALSRCGQGGSFRCKTVSTASVRKGAMTRRRASTATLSPSKTRSVECRATVFWSLGIRGRNQ